MTEPIYAIGDVHGFTGALDTALALIEKDGGAKAPLYFTGDLVDRGPDSKGVLDRLIGAQAAGRPWHVIKGNHDLAFENFLCHSEHNPDHDDSWIWPEPFGTITTLATYDVDTNPRRPIEAIFADGRAAVPEAHLRFLGGLPYHIVAGDILFVHAGIRPGVALEKQSIEDLIWIRDEFLNDERQHPWLIVHGHTTIKKPKHYGNRVNLDGGGGYGRLIWPVRFDAEGVWRLTDIGAEWLGPMKPGLKMATNRREG